MKVANPPVIPDSSKLRKRLEKIEKEIEKVRGCNPMDDGWQTQRYAKKSRKWDKLSEEKMKILEQLDGAGT